MQTRQQFNLEFPQFTEYQQRSGYHFLEVVHPEQAADPFYRRLVMESLDKDGNLLCLRLTMPLDGSYLPSTAFSH